MQDRTTDEYATAADLYDWVVPYRERQDIAFFVEQGKESGGPVLEIGCGTGRVLIPTARAGIDIVGLDLSPAMLEVCASRLRAEPADVQKRITLVQDDMRRFELERTFALITLPFRPFQHLLTVEDQLACLGAIRRHLADTGRLVLDVFNPSIDVLAQPLDGSEIGNEPDFTTPDGRQVARRFRIVAHDRFEQINDVELIYYVTHPDGRTERLVHAFRMRYFFRFEVEHLLARAGFEIEHVYSDFDKSAFGSRYPGELLFVARRN
jgi:SAM-dependent methyltransferase